MDKIRRLPDSEFEIMNILWDLEDPIDRGQIEERLFEKHPIALTTLLTLLTRLSEKGFIRIEKGEVYIYGMHISPYEKGNIFNKDPLRVRKLLLHGYEINKMLGKIATKGYTVVPLRVYFKGSLVKVEIALARGKKLHDKRDDLQKRDIRRETEREFKVKNV